MLPLNGRLQWLFKEKGSRLKVEELREGLMCGLKGEEQHCACGELMLMDGRDSHRWRVTQMQAQRLMAGLMVRAGQMTTTE